MSRIFISYKHEDIEIASFVCSYIDRNSNYTGVMEKIDETRLEADLELERRLLDKISSCQQLIAVVSRNTARSWWVPWEIGIGSGKEYKMASYIQNLDSSLKNELPSYLSMRPILGNSDDIDDYFDVQESSHTIPAQGRVFLVNQKLPTGDVMSAEKFHRALNERLQKRRGF